MIAFASEASVGPRREPRTTIRVTGVLDVAQARRITEILKNAGGTGELHVDLRGTRDAHDAAVVALAQALKGRNAVILGLSRRQERLLDYVSEVLDAG